MEFNLKMLLHENMTAEGIKQFIDFLKSKPKIDILYTFNGLDAMKKAKQIAFPYDTEEATKWENTWTTAEKKKSCLIIYSRQMRVNKHIYSKFIIGDSAIGDRFTYANGMKMIESVV